MAVFRPGQPVFMEGEAGHCLYLVLEGSVHVEKDDPRASRPQRLATLRRGAFFGEMALLAELPRSATVRAADNATLLEVSRSAVVSLVARDERVLTLLMRFFRARLVGTFMATSPLFRTLSGPERRELVTRFRLRELPAGHEVLVEGKIGDGLYIVLVGELVAYSETDDRVLGSLHAGAAFGEMSLLADTAATASVRAVTRSWVLRLPPEEFTRLIDSHPEVRRALEELATERKRENQRLAALGDVRPI